MSDLTDFQRQVHEPLEIAYAAARAQRDRHRAERDALAARVETAESLLRECETVMFEGVREDALTITGCESWDEVREDSDEVRWRVQKFLGDEVVNRERFKRIGRAEAAEARVETLENTLLDQAEPIMDETFRDRLLRGALSPKEIGDLVDAIYQRQQRALAALASRPAGEETQG